MNFDDIYVNGAPKMNCSVRIVLNSMNSWTYPLKSLVKTNKNRLRPVMRIPHSQALSFDLKLHDDAPAKGYTQYLKLRFK